MNIFHGWTPPIAPPKPATMSSLRALINSVAAKSPSPQRDNALAALDNAMECLSILADAENYDCTPCPAQPFIDMDTIPEVPF